VAGYFLDSSAVAKLYHDEAGSEEMRRLFGAVENHFYLSRLGVIELQSVFARKVLTGEISTDDVGVLRARFLNDLRQRSLRVTALTALHYDAAERLVQEHGARLRLRTLDALQLAVALDLTGRGLASRFVTADKTLCEVAQELRLSVWNPEGGLAP